MCFEDSREYGWGSGNERLPGNASCLFTLNEENNSESPRGNGMFQSDQLPLLSIDVPVYLFFVLSFCAPPSCASLDANEITFVN